MTLTRRNIMALAAGAGLVPFAPGVQIAKAATPSAGNNILVFIYLRGGMDGLAMVAPAEDGIYRDNRRNSAVRSSGVNAGLPVGALDGTPFFLHPAARQLKLMYDNKSLAIVHAAGVPTTSRSHFESQALVDLGMASNEPTPGAGWLTRHLQTRPGALGDFSATTDSATGSSALVGAVGLIPTESLEYLPNSIDAQRGALIAAVNEGNSASAQAARRTVKLLDVIRDKTAKAPPAPTGNGSYTFGPLSQSLKPLARVLKLDLGVEVAVVDYPAVWDTHENILQFFTNATREFSDSLFAFTDDLGDLMSRVTIVAMTEFGRRVEENSNGGTDHGEASCMFALGAGVNGGKIYGQWPGLADTKLSGGDLKVTTDYRQVLSELLVKRMGQTSLDQVFPTIKYTPLGLAR